MDPLCWFLCSVDSIFGYRLNWNCGFQPETEGISTATSEETNQGGCDTNSSNINSHHGVCAICLNKILLQETALVKGCEHAYWFVWISIDLLFCSWDLIKFPIDLCHTSYVEEALPVGRRWSGSFLMLHCNCYSWSTRITCKLVFCTS